MNDADEPRSGSVEIDDRAVYRTVVGEWSQGREPDTLAALERFPQLRLEKSIILDLAYEEFVLRTDRGEDVDLEAFCARFREHRSSVRKEIETHVGLKDVRGVLAEGPTKWPETGDLLGDYRLQRQLGRGGFARVFHAIHLVTGQQLAVKVTPANAKEPRLLGQFNHPNVAEIKDARILPGGWTALVMPYVGNSTLTDLLDVAVPRPGAPARERDLVMRAARRNRQPGDPPVAESRRERSAIPRDYVPAVLRLATEIADGLAYLHSKQVVHRDLKPSNVLLTWDGRPVILDFNLAESNKGTSRRGAGTLYYMAPEQIAAGLGVGSGAACDERADFFSFGVLMYELLTGSHPFSMPDSRGSALRDAKQNEFAKWLTGQQRSGCPHLRQHVPGIDPAVDRLVMQCLAFDPKSRPESASAIVRELDRIQAFGHRSVVTVRRRLKLIALGAGIALAAAAYPAYKLATRPPRAVRVFNLAKEHARLGALDKARDELDEILRDDPKNTDARFLRGLVRLRQKEFDFALDDFAKVRDYAPEGKVFAMMAYAYALNGSHNAAIEHADKAEKLGFSNPALFNNRAYSKLKTVGISNVPAKLAGVRSDLKQAIELDERFAAAYFNRAELEFIEFQNARGNPELLASAVQDIERAIDLGFVTSKSCYDAALFHMVGPNHTNQREAVLAHLRRARLLGRDLTSILKIRHFQPLFNDPEFVAELKASAGGSNPGNGDGLIDPMGREFQ